MARFLIDPVVHHQIATDVARRDAQRPGDADEDMRMVLAHAIGGGEGFFGDGAGMRGPGLVFDPLENACGQAVEHVEPAFVLPAHFRGQLAHARAGLRLPGLAEEAP